MNDKFALSDKVELFPQKAGWHFIRVPKEHSEATQLFADRGLVAITVTVGETSWKTSLLPIGDGTHFIALPAKIRKSEKILLGSKS